MATLASLAREFNTTLHEVADFAGLLHMYPGEELDLGVERLLRAAWTAAHPSMVNAPTDVILAFLAQEPSGSPWVPISGKGEWFTTATFRVLLVAGRLTVRWYSGNKFHGHLDGVPVDYTRSLYNILSVDATELKPSAPSVPDAEPRV